MTLNVQRLRVASCALILFLTCGLLHSSTSAPPASPGDGDKISKSTHTLTFSDWWDNMDSSKVTDLDPTPIKNFDFDFYNPPSSPFVKGLDFNNEKYKWDAYTPRPIPDTTYQYTITRVNGYHAGVGSVVGVLIFLICRWRSLRCCRVQDQNQGGRQFPPNQQGFPTVPRNIIEQGFTTVPRNIIVIRETPVTPLIIQRRQRSEGTDKENLIGNSEAPADDPPSYETCTRPDVEDPNLTPNVYNETTTPNFGKEPSQA